MMIEYANPKKSPPPGSWLRAMVTWMATSVGWMMIAIVSIGLLSVALAFLTLPPVGVVSGIVLLLLLAIAGRGRDGTAFAGVLARSYAALYAAVAIGIVSMILIFVIPKFEAIFKDFRLQLPPATQWLLVIARASYAPIALIVAIMTILLVA